MKHAVLGLLALLALSRPAHAEDVALPRTLAHLVVPDDWKAMRVRGIVAAYQRDGGGILAVTRADVPNTDAWIRERKQAYVDQVYAGIRAALPTARKLTRKLGDMNGVPVLDVEGVRDGAPIVVRVLLFRTYALSLAIEVPKGTDIAIARGIAQTFGPATPLPKD